MKSAPMKASKLSYALIAASALMIVAVVAGCILAGSLLQKKSVEATHAAIDAEVSDGATTRVLSLEMYLKQNASVVDNTAQIAGSIGQYQQNTIIATINGYASKAGVSITGFNFGTATTTGAAPTGETTVTVGSPVDYRKFVIFLNLLENGIMPVTVTSALLSPDSTSTNSVNVSEMKIKVAN